MTRSKISIIGSGKVGATTAQWIASKGLADVALVDVVDGLPQGSGLDILEALPVLSSSVSVMGSCAYDVVTDSDIIILTAGKARTPGMSRDDLLTINARIVSQAATESIHRAPNALFIVVTNPLDVMAHVVMKTCCLPKNRIMGMAGILDTSRFKSFVSAALGVSPLDVQALVLGSHGDAMLPIIRTVTVGGVPLQELMSEEDIEALVHRTRNGGAEIVSLLKSGSAYVAPAASVCEMVESILKDQRRILPCSVWLTGEYGLQDVFMGVPVVLGASGIERIVEMALTEEEQNSLTAAADSVKEMMRLV